MKMMSWSRYHCLSKSLLRAERRYRAAKMLKRRQRRRAPHPRPPAPGAGSEPTRYFQFVIRLFRHFRSAPSSEHSQRPSAFLKGCQQETHASQQTAPLFDRLVGEK